MDRSHGPRRKRCDVVSFVFSSSTFRPTLQGAAIASSLSLGLSYCVCTATNSLCNACLGAHTGTGRKRSVLLLTIALACSLWFQYDVGPAIVHKGGGWVGTLVSQVAYNQWYDACEQYAPDDALITACARNAGVFRPLFLAAFLFTLFALATKAQPSFNREAWPAKLMVRTLLRPRSTQRSGPIAD